MTSTQPMRARSLRLARIGLAAVAPTERIDFITASPNIAAFAAAIPADDLASTASDHRPMVATLRVPRGSENHP